MCLSATALLYGIDVITLYETNFSLYGRDIVSLEEIS